MNKEEIIKQIEMILDELKETGVANEHLNNVIDMLFALKLRLELEKEKE
jgi:Zn-finger domain-containing protein